VLDKTVSTQGARLKMCRYLCPDEGVSVTYFFTDPALSGASRIVAPPLPHLDLHPAGRPQPAFALAFDLDPRRPVKHAGLRSGTPSLSEVPSVGARALFYFWGSFPKVTRRKGHAFQGLGLKYPQIL
jgi:hypothetical protein